MSNFAYDKLLSYTDNPMLKIPLDRAKQKLLASILESHFARLPESEMDDIVNENYHLMAVSLRLKEVFAFREELENNTSEKYYASFRKRNKYDEWIEACKTEITVLSVFLSQYFISNVKNPEQVRSHEVQDLTMYVRHILANREELYQIDKNPYTFAQDVDAKISEINKHIPAFAKVSNILLTLFAVIFISNLAMAIWFHSFGLLFWGIFLFSTILPVAVYRGIRVLMDSNGEKEKLNGWKMDIRVKEKMDEIIVKTKKKR